MLDRLIALVPFVERKIRKEDLSTQVLKKAMELCAEGGFHYVWDDGREHFGVISRSATDKFLVQVGRTIDGKGVDDDCMISRMNDDGSRDVLTIAIGRFGDYGSAMFLVDRITRELAQERLDKKQRLEFISSFLNSAVDVEATQREFCSIQVEDAEFLQTGTGNSLEWVRDMGRPVVIGGLLT